jgi:hypothetical protein
VGFKGDETRLNWENLSPSDLKNSGDEGAFKGALWIVSQLKEAEARARS